jgi:hypothetical protein
MSEDALPAPDPEAPAAMLDVHASHGPVHSWKDFFIHVATISVGLLIALGLENLAEHIHHRHQLSEARRDLAAELNQNRRDCAANVAEAQAILAKLDADMALLRASQSARQAVVGKLDYETLSFHWPVEGAWQVVRQNGSLGLMPHNEVVSYVYLYEAIAFVKEKMMALTTHARVADAIAHRAPDGHFTARDIEELITVTSEARGDATFLTGMLQIEQFDLSDLNRVPHE